MQPQRAGLRRRRHLHRQSIGSATTGLSTLTVDVLVGTNFNGPFSASVMNQLTVTTAGNMQTTTFSAIVSARFGLRLTNIIVADKMTTKPFAQVNLWQNFGSRDTITFGSTTIATNLLATAL